MEGANRAKELLNSVSSTTNLIIASLAFIYVISRFRKVKSFAKIKSQLQEIDVFQGEQENEEYHKAKSAEKKRFKKRYKKQSNLIQWVAFMIFALVVAGYKEFAFPALVMIANASGTKIPHRMPILGSFSHDLDKFWNTMCNSKLNRITNEMGVLDKELGRKLRHTMIVGAMTLGLGGKKYDDVDEIILYKKSKKAQRTYGLILMKGYIKVIALALVISFLLNILIPEYEFNDKVRDMVIALVVGYIACKISIILILMAIRENPTPREVAEKKESFLMRKFSDAVSANNEWVVRTTPEQRLKGKYERDRVSPPSSSQTEPITGKAGRYG